MIFKIKISLIFSPSSSSLLIKTVFTNMTFILYRFYDPQTITIIATKTNVFIQNITNGKVGWRLLFTVGVDMVSSLMLFQCFVCNYPVLWLFSSLIWQSCAADAVFMYSLLSAWSPGWDWLMLLEYPWPGAWLNPWSEEHGDPPGLGGR